MKIKQKQTPKDRDLAFGRRSMWLCIPVSHQSLSIFREIMLRQLTRLYRERCSLNGFLCKVHVAQELSTVLYCMYSYKHAYVSRSQNA